MEKKSLMELVTVDTEDQWLLETYGWRINDTGYVVHRMRFAGGIQRTVFLHHCIAGYPIREGEEIDHIDRNKLNNRKDNLRYTTQSQNRINVTRKPNTTGERNVYHKEGRYTVRIRRGGIENFVGSYTTVTEAVVARDAWLTNVSEDNNG